MAKVHDLCRWAQEGHIATETTMREALGTRLYARYREAVEYVRPKLSTRQRQAISKIRALTRRGDALHARASCLSQRGLQALKRLPLDQAASRCYVEVIERVQELVEFWPQLAILFDRDVNDMKEVADEAEGIPRLIDSESEHCEGMPSWVRREIVAAQRSALEMACSGLAARPHTQ
jgi:hypothetical protein